MKQIRELLIDFPWPVASMQIFIQLYKMNTIQKKINKTFTRCLVSDEIIKTQIQKFQLVLAYLLNGINPREK